MDAIRNRVKPEPVDRFTALMETETQRLADMESAAAAAHAAQEGVERELVNAKLDGLPAAQLSRLETAADERRTARDAADQAIARQRAHIDALRTEHEQREHNRAVSEAEDALAAARDKWPDLRSRVVSQISALKASWAEMQAVGEAEQRAAIALLRVRDGAGVDRWALANPETHLPTEARQKFPIAESVIASIAKPLEAWERERAERRAAREADLAEHSPHRMTPTPPVPLT